MHWEYRKVFAPGHFDLVAASVPCNEYSQAKKVGVRDMESADKLVRKIFGNY
jgi:site-specific DNA-cytosine methylase